MHAPQWDAYIRSMFFFYCLVCHRKYLIPLEVTFLSPRPAHGKIDIASRGENREGKRGRGGERASPLMLEVFQQYCDLTARLRGHELDFQARRLQASKTDIGTLPLPVRTLSGAV